LRDLMFWQQWGRIVFRDVSAMSTGKNFPTFERDICLYLQGQSVQKHRTWTYWPWQWKKYVPPQRR
jgi:hypothetical protein